MKNPAIIAQQHHERFDGKGYPDKLKGEEIHSYAIITAIVDVFDALSRDRVYRKAIPIADVISKIESGRGTHFDPYYLDIFMKNLEQVQLIMKNFKDHKGD